MLFPFLQYYESAPFSLFSDSRKIEYIPHVGKYEYVKQHLHATVRYKVTNTLHRVTAVPVLSTQEEFLADRKVLRSEKKTATGKTRALLEIGGWGKS
jgi:hypothetical protein